jgi:OOP family OmpA-OmpF porin
MKNFMCALVLAVTASTVNAQAVTEKSSTVDFNKWSIELAGGLNKPMRPLTAGYRTAVASAYVADLGVRYMFNNKFGLKADFGYNSFKEGENSVGFDSKYYRANLQAVANLGRIMSFETWTNTIGLLGHAGVGLGFGESENFTGTDRMGNFMAGLTGQIKLTNRVALTGDFTTILNAKQNRTFDGASVAGTPGFGGVLFNGTVGLTVYLGKNTEHADWVTLVDKDVLALQDRVSTLENMLLDGDQDGVADILDVEKNTAAGAMVDTKGKSIDKNNNKVPDETEDYIMKNYASKTSDDSVVYDNELIKSLINGGYVAVYFDFDKSTPTNVSTEGTDFILTYLRKNPTASVEINGYADELGRSDYNDKLSSARANNVKNTLVQANIAESRLNIVAAGEDTSVNKDSEAARKLVRRVTFTVK